MFLSLPFEIENENNMVSSFPQDETNKNLKYGFKEPVIRFTYHSRNVPFGWRGIRPVVLFKTLKNESTLASHLCCKEIAIFVDGMSARKSFIDRTIAISDMNWAVLSSR